MEEDQKDRETLTVREIMENNQYNNNYKNLGNFCNTKKGREQKDEENKTVCKQPTIDQEKLFTFT
jgi:hypothetical protein